MKRRIDQTCGSAMALPRRGVTLARRSRTQRSDRIQGALRAEAFVASTAQGSIATDAVSGPERSAGGSAATADHSASNLNRIVSKTPGGGLWHANTKLKEKWVFRCGLGAP